MENGVGGSTREEFWWGGDMERVNELTRQWRRKWETSGTLFCLGTYPRAKRIPQSFLHNYFSRSIKDLRFQREPSI